LQTRIATDLGGGVIKQRLAQTGRGKAGGFRTRVIFRAGDRAVFVHGFAKSEKDTIQKDQLAALKKLAAESWPMIVRTLKAKEIRALRLREGASQAVLARYLNVTTCLMSQWERGEKRPQGAALPALRSRERISAKLRIHQSLVN
jgi:hypothetical protein